jgi:hypothetical protein
VYCEHEITPALVGTTSSKLVQPNASRMEMPPDDIVFFADETSARQAGYHVKDQCA